MRLLTGVVLSTLLFVPIAAWAFIKPVRILAPELAGVTCVTEHICLDDLSKADEVERLYYDAIEFVESKVGVLATKPRGVFCQSLECSSQFGLHKGSYGYAGAYNVGTAGFVISHRGWQPHFVRHEVIHHLQNERLGSIDAWFFKPMWFKEGMAYTLSEDPRIPLPPSLESYRKKYKDWVKGFDFHEVWDEAGKL